MSDSKLDQSVSFAFLPELYSGGGGFHSELSLGGALEVFIDRKIKDDQISPKTVKSYQFRVGALISHLGRDRALASVTLADLRDFKDFLEGRKTRYPAGVAARPEVKGGLSPVTIREHVRAAKIFFNWLFEEELIEVNPAARLKIPSPDVEQKEGISTPDLLEMIRAAKYGGQVRDYALLLFFRDTGCRLGGAVGLTIKRLWVSKQECKLIEKGSKARKAYFLEDTAAALGEWLERRPKSPGHDHVFTGKQGAALLDNGVYRVFERYAQRARVTGEWNPHGWRHWRSREWEIAGMPDSVRSQLLGHSLKGMGVTAGHYSRLSEEALRAEYFKYTRVPSGENTKL